MNGWRAVCGGLVVLIGCGVTLAEAAKGKAQAKTTRRANATTRQTRAPKVPATRRARPRKAKTTPSAERAKADARAAAKIGKAGVARAKTAPSSPAKPVRAKPPRPAPTKAPVAAKGWSRVDRTPVKVALPSGVKPMPIPVFVNRLGMRFIRVQPGSFTMGSPDTEAGRNNDELAHPVKIRRPYYVGTTEVTVGQWQQFIKQAKYAWTHTAEAKLVSPTNAHPIVFVSWQDAAAFCKWLGKVDGATYRLPTEAEWEYACRAGVQTAFSFGDQAKPDCMACGRRSAQSSPVAAFPANRWGLHDMHGNVWEWCHDWYDREGYAAAPAKSPTGPPDGDARVIRSGSWQDPADYCRSANRSGRWPDERYEDLGFRVVREE